MPAVPRHVVIIGGGITGLTAAYALNENVRRYPSAGRPITCTLVEASPRLGGKILTERSNGFVIEAGPESFLAQKPWGIDLCRRLGLTESLIPTNPEHRKTFVLLGGRLHELPQGLVLGVPGRRIGWMCKCGIRLPDSGEGTCKACGERLLKFGQTFSNGVGAGW